MFRFVIMNMYVRIKRIRFWLWNCKSQCYHSCKCKTCMQMFNPYNILFIDIDLYFWKRNNLSQGISLTTQTWFLLLLLFCNLFLSAKLREILNPEVTSISLLFPYYSISKRQRKIKSNVLVWLIPGIRVD